MAHSNDDNTSVQERETNRNDHELDQMVNFYFLDNHGKLHKTQQLPKEIEHFVWESRRTLETEEYLFTLAYSHSCEGYETILANQVDMKENEREKIAGGFLGLAAPGSTVDVQVMQIGTNKNAIDSILRDIHKSLSVDHINVFKSVIIDCGFAETILLNCRRLKKMPVFKLIWREDAYQIYTKQRGGDHEIEVGTIRTSHDADLFCQLYEKLLLLNSENA